MSIFSRLTNNSLNAAGFGMILFALGAPVHFLVPLETSTQMAALTLALIAGAYIGFGAASGKPAQFWTELAAALLFALTALAGLTLTPLAIPAGLIAHALWDILHHSPRTAGAVPRWYVPFCATFDLAAAALLTIRYYL